MKINCISDLHGFYPELPGGDLLIIAGDLTATDNEKNWVDFEAWLYDQDYKEKIIIAGNHDNFLQSTDEHCMCKYWEKVGITYLCDSGTEFCSLKIWGSPWTNWFNGVHPKCKAFMSKEKEISKKFDLIPNDIDILITHSPPYDILDKTTRGECVGSKSLLIKTLEVRPRLHIFGHIHEEGGKQFIFKRHGIGDENNTLFINASIMNEKYLPVNKPITIEI